MKKKKERAIISSVVFAVVMMGMLYFGFQNVAYQAKAKDYERVEQAVRKAAMTCYSIEGYYPRDVAYLKEFYGLYLDEASYLIHYEWIANNLSPHIRVFSRTEGTYETSNK